MRGDAQESETKAHIFSRRHGTEKVRTLNRECKSVLTSEANKQQQTIPPCDSKPNQPNNNYIRFLLFESHQPTSSTSSAAAATSPTPTETQQHSAYSQTDTEEKCIVKILIF